MEPFDFGANLCTLRKQRKMSQQQLADLLHITDGMVSKYETNFSEPPYETLRSIASIFNVSMDDLCGMKRQGTVSTHGLSESQTETLKALIEAYRLKNTQTGKALTEGQFAILGRIVAELLK